MNALLIIHLLFLYYQFFINLIVYIIIHAYKEDIFLKLATKYSFEDLQPISFYPIKSLYFLKINQNFIKIFIFNNVLLAYYNLEILYLFKINNSIKYF